MNRFWSSLASRTGLLLLCSILLVASNEARWLTSTASLLPPVSDSLSAPASAWQAPLALVPEINAVSRWPWLAYAGVAAGIITALCRSGDSTCGSFLTTFALSLAIDPLHVVPAAALLALAFADGVSRSRNPAFVQSFWIALGTMLAVLGTLEFGLILFVALWILLTPRASTSEVPEHFWRNGLIAAAILLLVVGLTHFSQGFWNCLLRPVNWVSASRHPELFRTLSPTYYSFGDWETVLLLGGLATSWVEMARARNFSLWRLIPLSLLTVLGMSCLRYLWLSTFAVAVLGRAKSPTTESSWIARVGGLCALASALALFAVRTDWVAFLAGDVAAHRIDVSAWTLRGPVMLLDLDRSSDWQSSPERNTNRLVIDDRWDIHGDRYGDYALICHDMRHARQHSYLRTDDSWGGYARWLKSWDPLMLVADPKDDVGLRRLSLSPDWRFMGMDGERVIFGRSGDPTTLPVMNAALNCLLTLEWPANVEGLDIETTIVAPAPADRRTAASVLCAMRLPYAALRFLRGDDSSAADWLRTACYVELAHRVRSHSGLPSLLDQLRAVARIRRFATSTHLGAGQQRRLAHNLMSLGLNDLSRELFPETSPLPGEEYEVVEAKVPAGAVETMESASPELRMREALAMGDVTACRTLLAELSERERSYYSIFINAPDRNAEELRDDFGTFLSGFPDLAAAMRSEALFYQGCAALEAGDTGQAILALGQSEQLAPNLPQQTIRRLFLAQLISPIEDSTGPERTRPGRPNRM